MAVVIPNGKFTVFFEDSRNDSGWTETWYANTSDPTVDALITLARGYVAVRLPFLLNTVQVTGARASKDLVPRSGQIVGPESLGLNPVSPVGFFHSRITNQAFVSADVLFYLLQGHRKWIYLRGIPQEFYTESPPHLDVPVFRQVGFQNWYDFVIKNLAVKVRVFDSPDAPFVSVGSLVYDYTKTPFDWTALTLTQPNLKVGDHFHLYGPRRQGLPLGEKVVTEVAYAVSPYLTSWHSKTAYKAQTLFTPGMELQGTIYTLVQPVPGAAVFFRGSHRKPGRPFGVARGRSSRGAS